MNHSNQPDKKMCYNNLDKGSLRKQLDFGALLPLGQLSVDNFRHNKRLGDSDATL